MIGRTGLPGHVVSLFSRSLQFRGSCGFRMSHGWETLLSIHAYPDFEFPCVDVKSNIQKIIPTLDAQGAWADSYQDQKASGGQNPHPKCSCLYSGLLNLAVSKDATDPVSSKAMHLLARFPYMTKPRCLLTTLWGRSDWLGADSYCSSLCSFPAHHPEADLA